MINSMSAHEWRGPQQDSVKELERQRDELMDALEVSHCKDAALIRAAIASVKGVK